MNLPDTRCTFRSKSLATDIIADQNLQQLRVQSRVFRMVMRSLFGRVVTQVWENCLVCAADPTRRCQKYGNIRYARRETSVYIRLTLGSPTGVLCIERIIVARQPARYMYYE